MLTENLQQIGYVFSGLKFDLDFPRSREKTE